ncbi:MAG: response regulator, partial [Fidelibacterota bacterium]
MDKIPNFYREALKAHIDALEAAKKALHASDPDALDSIRRIAHTLKGSGGTVGLPEITEAATRVEEFEEGQLLEPLDTLLDVLREVCSGGGELPYSILVIEDDPVTGRTYEALLSADNREIHLAETAEQASEILAEKVIAIILLDLILPDTDGRNFLIKLREDPKYAAIPVIVVSAKGSPATKAECFALGADDYFEKPVNLEILSAAVASRLQRSEDQRRRSRTDPLTGLPNRAAFAEAFQRAQSLATRSRDDLSLAILDLDRFKSLNDTYGHNMGDEVLRRMRPVMSEALRQTDFLARWGGEEFVVLFPKADTHGAARALEKALENFRKETFQFGGQTVSKVTFSAGVTDVSGQTELDEAVAKADRLLYLAKENGRDQVLAEEIEVPSSEKKILLAEDDEIVASVIKHRLGREGFEVIHFPDGMAALKGAAEVDVSLVILDVKMPGMDGFELLGNLRKMPAYKALPIVMLTSMGSEEDTVRGFELGADDYIMKPFSPVELLARIRRLTKVHDKPAPRPAIKILLVDDDPTILYTASTVLEKTGDFSVRQAHKVTEALEQARLEKPDIMVSDLMMPDMAGTALLKLLHDDQSLHDIPVVFLTAKTDPGQAEELIKQGAAGVIAKPFDPDELPTQIKHYIGT